MFGEDVTRSARSKEMLSRLADLNLKEMSEKLTTEEVHEQSRLRAMLPTEASDLPGTNKAEESTS